MKIAEMNNCIEKMREIYKAIENIRVFLLILMWKIKSMSEKEFAKLLKEENIELEQKLYLLYFRCI